MKAFGQSQLVDGSAYRHLGYTAASFTSAENLPLTVSIWLMAAGAIVAVGGVMLTRRYRWIGVVVVLLGLAGLVGAYVNLGESARIGRTRTMAAEAAEMIRGHGQDRQTIERYLDGSDPALELALMDAWNRRMRASIAQRFLNECVIVRSSGPDAAFDNSDDILAVHPIVQPATTRSVP